jgi:hypothetical protein
LENQSKLFVQFDPILFALLICFFQSFDSLCVLELSAFKQVGYRASKDTRRRQNSSDNPRNETAFFWIGHSLTPAKTPWKLGTTDSETNAATVEREAEPEESFELAFASGPLRTFQPEQRPQREHKCNPACRTDLGTRSLETLL